MFYLWYLQTGILQYFHGNIAICLFVSIKTKMQNIHIVAYRLVNIRKEAYACLWRFLWFGFLPLLKTYVAVKHAVFRKNFCTVDFCQIRLDNTDENTFFWSISVQLYLIGMPLILWPKSSLKLPEVRGATTQMRQNCVSNASWQTNGEWSQSKSGFLIKRKPRRKLCGNFLL